MASKTMHAIDAGGEWDLNPIAGGLGAMGSDSLLSARQVRNPVNSNSEIEDAFDAITYQKGGSVLNMFETYLGEEKFREGIRVHMRRFTDGVADADDFMASLAEGSGNEAITDSFRTFITQPGIPMPVSYTHKTLPDNKPGGVLGGGGRGRVAARRWGAPLGRCRPAAGFSPWVSSDRRRARGSTSSE